MTTIIALLLLIWGFHAKKTAKDSEAVVTTPDNYVPILRLRRIEEMTFVKNPYSGQFEPATFTKTKEVLSDSIR